MLQQGVGCAAGGVIGITVAASGGASVISAQVHTFCTAAGRPLVSCFDHVQGKAAKVFQTFPVNTEARSTPNE